MKLFPPSRPLGLPPLYVWTPIPLPPAALPYCYNFIRTLRCWQCMVGCIG
jgi:hypothetical protein